MINEYHHNHNLITDHLTGCRNRQNSFVVRLCGVVSCCQVSHSCHPVDGDGGSDGGDGDDGGGDGGDGDDDGDIDCHDDNVESFPVVKSFSL